ncbi:pseudouridine synthase [Rheinheimera sp.]|uniref:pseudouridine synthase n=1 Tax=Rheinheimera sp. TaxID=1869214 RepID=UPI0027BA996F|nr:pseudouridine synthase [Rheinheimera sp.]
MTTNFQYQPPQTPLELLYRDKDLLVLNKPSGLLTNPGKGEHLHDSLLTRVQAEFPTALLVHRLDMATSGLVVFALRRKAEAALKQQFANRTVKKTYLARVFGTPEPAAGVIDVPLIADLTAPPRNKVCFSQGKAAQTYYQLLPEAKNHAGGSPQNALLALFPLTGRAHQLRVHLLHLGHPILGDALYAPDNIQKSASRLLLHAMALEIQQPYSGQPLQFLQQPDLAAFDLSQPIALPANPYP